ncbi:MAG: DUF2145 domain-containing protein [Burkholderiales bacterium]|nr:DUF2145 domain-containing protein [Burkholderiales bacterium]
MPAAQGSGFSTASSTAGTRLNFTPEQLAGFAKKVERALAAQGAHVALLARMGRPLAEMPAGMQFTHVGIAVYSSITTTDGRKVPGYAIYNLYQKDGKPDVSELVQDYPVDFFAGVSVLEAGAIVPTPALQRRILGVIASPVYAALHDSRYSLIANPYNLGRQNCTEFVLDVVESALGETSDPAAIKAALHSGFRAQPVRVNPLKLVAGALFSAEVSLSDQDGTPVTATFETIARYLQERDPGTKVLHVLPD